MKQSRQTEIWTVLRMIEWGTQYFREKRIESPRLTIELMLAHVMKANRFELYMNFEQPVSQEELEELRAMIRRRVAREPLQYILGEAQFHRHTFVVRPGVLIPRPETELLVDEALRRTRPLRALDVGTGSGCIALTIGLERPETEVIAIDVTEEALAVARDNRERLAVPNVDIRRVDIFDDEAVGELGSFDLVISNPPYIPGADIPGLQEEVRNHEPHGAVSDGGDGLRFYRRFLELAPTILREEGEMFLELGFGQAGPVRELFQRGSPKRYRVDIYRDMEKVERILRVRNPETTGAIL